MSYPPVRLRILAGSAAVSRSRLRLLLVLLPAIGACDADAATFGPEEEVPAGIQLSVSSLDLAGGDTARITATLVGSSGRPVASPSAGVPRPGNSSSGVTWTSSDEEVVDITRSGLVQAKGNGDATITASSGSLRATSRIKVRGNKQQVVLTPKVDTLSALGQMLQLSATVYDSRGRVVKNAAVSWTSSNTGVLTVDAAGVVKAVATGMARVAAASEAGADTATLHVRQVVASVEVTPGAATLNAGQTQSFTAAAKDANGHTVPGVGLSWSSSNTSVATVSSTGSASAEAAGTASIRATAAGGITGSATATVLTATEPISAGSINECASARPEWIWCDDFEQDRLKQYFEYDQRNGSFVRASGAGREGSQGMRAQWQAGQKEAGSLKLAFGKTPQSYFRPVDAGTANYRTIYWRMYVRNQPGWTGGGADKLSRATSFVSSTSWAQSMIAHVWSGGNSNAHLVIDPASGTTADGTVTTTKYNDFANLRWLGKATGKTPLFSGDNLGQWHCVEAYTRLNDAGLSNGVFRMWINGALDAERTGLNWVGSYSEYGINAVFFENYWNSGSPVAQERYFDNLVVSTKRIGC